MSDKGKASGTGVPDAEKARYWSKQASEHAELALKALRG